MVPLTAIAGELTFLQAGSLAQLAFEHQVRHIKARGAYSLDPMPYNFNAGARFAGFEVIGVWGKPDEAADAILGRFAVDRLTADVWDIYADCVRIDYPALRDMQRAYRTRYHLPARQTVTAARPPTC